MEVTIRAIGSLKALQVVVDRLKKAFPGKVWASAPLKNERDPGHRIYINVVVDEKDLRENDGDTR